MNFTKEQHTRINAHLDSINAYLSTEVQPNIHGIVKIELENSSIRHFSISPDEVYLSHNSEIMSFDLSRETTCFKSAYDHPQVGYDLLLNWQQIKRHLSDEVTKQKTERDEIDFMIDVLFKL